ncbi:ATP-binding cassette domain-containing protein [Tumebacillus permanentifrigoris]|uniref:ABC-type multidrug transport system ATPase subunit n=1 Tax=Tumebacillus permanentifrigoris TaxID=378543 RepID=A0A316D6D6_9BACL|nr:ATP-binding cassette domain-containing protein [Tumebacillus permanentifrigoris]PWK10286.1 ABC-type multidrug transport system ATPase subunit [Tumebacillus permanentifrigoris]
MMIEVNGLQFETGFNAVLGPRGAGKTRLLKQLIESDAAHASGEVCYVTQELEAFETYTVLDTLLETGVTPDLALGAMRQMRLSAYAQSHIHRLPKLAKVQTLIARALLHDPKLLVLDEVLDGLSDSERLVLGHSLLEVAADRVVVVADAPDNAIEGLLDKVCLLHPEKPSVMVTTDTAYEWVEGKVFEYLAEALPAEGDRLVLQLKQDETHVCVREIAAQVPAGEVSHVSPTLRDAYVWWAKQQ